MKHKSHLNHICPKFSKEKKKKLTVIERKTYLLEVHKLWQARREPLCTGRPQTNIQTRTATLKKWHRLKRRKSWKKNFSRKFAWLQIQLWRKNFFIINKTTSLTYFFLFEFFSCFEGCKFTKDCKISTTSKGAKRLSFSNLLIRASYPLPTDGQRIALMDRVVDEHREEKDEGQRGGFLSTNVQRHNYGTSNKEKTTKIAWKRSFSNVSCRNPEGLVWLRNRSAILHGEVSVRLTLCVPVFRRRQFFADPLSSRPNAPTRVLASLPRSAVPPNRSLVAACVLAFPARSLAPQLTASPSSPASGLTPSAAWHHLRSWPGALWPAAISPSVFAAWQPTMVITGCVNHRSLKWGCENAGKG